MAERMVKQLKQEQTRVNQKPISQRQDDEAYRKDSCSIRETSPDDIKIRLH